MAVSVWKDRKGKERPGFAHAFVAENADAETIGTILKRLDVSKAEIEPLINVIRSDGWRSYQTVSKKLDIIHNRAVLRDPKDSMKLLPWTHKVIANAKAVFAGPHRGVSRKHLQGYLSEVCYRFNRRFWGREVFHRLLFACASTSTITRDELMSKKQERTTCINIYGNKVAVLSWSEPISIIIENKEIADNFRYYFDTLWSVLK